MKVSITDEATTSRTRSEGGAVVVLSGDMEKIMGVEQTAVFLFPF